MAVRTNRFRLGMAVCFSIWLHTLVAQRNSRKGDSQPNREEDSVVGLHGTGIFLFFFFQYKANFTGKTRHMPF